MKSPLHKLLYPRLLFILTLAISLSITFAVIQYSRQNARENLEAVFDFHVYETIQRIKNRMNSYEQVLKGTRGLFAVKEQVTRKEFKLYIELLQLEKKYPGIQGVGFSLIIPKELLNQHIEEIRKQGFPEYNIRPDTERNNYTSIVQLEPFTGRNLRAFGYDMFSEPIRREAMEKARDNGNAVISGKVKLVQETTEKVQSGFLMYLPVYKNNFPHETLEERNKNIIGWVYEPFRMNDFINALSSKLTTDINIEIYDNILMSEYSRMYDSDNIPNTCSTKNPKISTVQYIEITNHLWTLSICSTPTLESTIDNNKSLIIAITGCILSFMLSLVVFLLSNGQVRANAIALDMTSELREKNETLTRFAEISAHHLMEPTRRLISYTQILRNHLSEIEHDAKINDIFEPLKILEKDAVRLNGLVRDIQLYLSAGEPRGVIQSENMNSILKNLESKYKDRFEILGVSLKVEILPFATLDSPRLMDLFEIIINNTLTHGLPAYPTMPCIHIYGERLEKISRFYVRDNGLGISPEYFERVFGIFERLDSRSSGNGIGLSIARRIVESRHGKIWIENAHRGGLIVVFELPDGE